MQNIDKDERFVRYLLGELSAEEREALEQQYFQDDEFFQELLFIENDLIDSYVRGELSAADRRKFESRFLSTASGREKVELSRALLSSITTTPKPVVATEARRSWWQSVWHPAPVRARAWQFVTLLLLFAGGAGWLAVENLRLRSQLAVATTSAEQNQEQVKRLQEQVAAAQQQQQQQETASQASIQQLTEDLQRERTVRDKAEQIARQQQKQIRENRGPGGPSEREQSAIAAYIFPYNPVRGTNEQAQPLTINTGQRTVAFQIDLGRTAYRSHQISIQTVEGAEVWKGVVKKTKRTREGNFITVSLPASVFTRQDYILIVTPFPTTQQTESIAEYSFRVVHRP